MDDIQQLGEMLRHYAASEAHKKQLFDSQSVVWARRIHQLFGQIEDWLAPVLLPDLLALQREPYVAFSPAVPLEVSTFKSEKLTIHIAGKPVELATGKKINAVAPEEAKPGWINLDM